MVWLLRSCPMATRQRELRLLALPRFLLHQEFPIGQTKGVEKHSMQSFTLSIILSLCALTLCAQTSLMMDGRSSGATGEFQTPPSTIGDLRMELRIHSSAPLWASDNDIVNGYNLFIAVIGSQQTLRVVNWNTPDGGSETIDIRGLRDFIVRVQDVVSTATTTIEVWSIDGKVYRTKKFPGRSSILSGRSPLQIGHNGQGVGAFLGGLAYLRLYDSTVPLGMSPTTSAAGALLAYEFDSRTAAYSSVGTLAGKPLQVFGNTTFANTPVFTPIVNNIPSEVTVSTNTPVTLNATGSLSGAPVSIWRWSQIAGPSQVSISNGTSGTPLLSGLSMPGTYTMQVTLTDALGTTGTGQVTIGAVNANSLGVVTVSRPDLSFALGPLLKSGLSPWPFYDQLRQQYGRRWGAAYPAGPPGEYDFRQGSIFLTNNSKTIAGSGTNFISDFMEPIRFGIGTVSVSAGGSEVRGNSTRFIDTFLTQRTAAAGTISVSSSSGIVHGTNTSFTSTTEPGRYLVVSVDGKPVSLRISRVISNTSVEIERPWRGIALASRPFENARDVGQSLAIRDSSGRTWLSAVVVVSDTSLFLRTPFLGQGGVALPYGSTKLGPAAFLVAHYPVGNGTLGRILLPIQSVSSDSSLALNTTYSGVNYRMISFGGTSQADLDQWMGQVNYYDSVLVQYQNYYRTGLEDYRTYARKLADAWYLDFDSGRNKEASPYAPRTMSLTGLMLRAMDGRPEMWPMIRRAVSYNYNLWIGMRIQYGGLYYGPREGGFTLYHAALLGAVDPDPSFRYSFRQLALDAATNLYARLQLPDGSWRWTDESYWSGLGEQPFHVGVLLEGMIATHRITRDSRVLSAIIKSVDHLISVQMPAPCRGPVYALYVDGGDWGRVCTGSNTTPSVDAIRDVRAGNNTIMHAVGYVYSVTGQTKYRDAGDDMFAATFGNLDGPLADQYYGRADSDMKQYGQSFRTSDEYLALRTAGVMDIFR